MELWDLNEFMTVKGLAQGGACTEHPAALGCEIICYTEKSCKPGGLVSYVIACRKNCTSFVIFKITLENLNSCIKYNELAFVHTTATLSYIIGA